MRRFAIIAAFLLTGCGDDESIKQCEGYVLNKLKAPSTYKRIDATAAAVPYQKPKEWSVAIEYDAANSYGTPIRDTQICIFPLKEGRPVTSQYIDFDARFLDQAADAMNQVDAAIANAVSANQ